MPPAQPASHFDNSMNGLTAAVLKHNTPLTLRTLANIRSFTVFRFHTITKPHGLRRRALFQTTFPKKLVKFIPCKHIGVLALFPDPFNTS